MEDTPFFSRNTSIPGYVSAETRFTDLTERFQFATDAAQIGYWFCDLPFDQLIWDNRVKDHFWLPPDADVDINLFYERLHPHDRKRTQDAINASIENHSRYDIEYRTVAPDGRQKCIRAIGRTAYDEQGKAVRFDGITQDITASRRAETELRESRQQLATFIDSIPALAWVANPDGHIYHYNRRWFEYTGTTIAQMEGQGWHSVHDPERLPAVIESWSYSLRTGESFEMTFPLKGADGVFRLFLTRVTPMRGENGAILRWFGTNTEVDELERTRRQLQLHEDRVRLALQNISLVLYTTDLDLRYTWMYRATSEYPAEAMLGRRDIDLDPVRFAELHALKKSVLHTGTPTRRELRYDFNGRIEIFDYTIEPLRDTDGNIVGLTVAALDITHMRLSEDALRKAEKLAVVGRLAASIAHEINNPLESVVSLLYVARNMATNEEQRGYLTTAEEELYRVSHVVTQSLSFHRQSNTIASTRVSTLIESALALYRGRFLHSPIELITEFSDTDSLPCYTSELRQVFANLIGNAFEATRSGKIILRTHPSVDWRTGEPGIRAVVADTGCGIDSKTLQSLFEPFVTTKGELGTGLGLWVSAEILKRHHAPIRVRSSTTAGRSGTVFSIFFPLLGPGPTQSAPNIPVLPESPI